MPKDSDLALGASERKLFEEMLAERAIRNTLMRYFRGVDRKDFDMIASAYHPDAYDDHGRYKGDIPGLIEWIRERHEIMDQAMHFAGNMLIEVDGKTAVVETYSLCFQHLRVEGMAWSNCEPVYRKVTVCFRYVDRFEERNGEWKIAHRICVYDWAKETLEQLPSDETRVMAKRSREDAIYRIKNARPPDMK